MGCYGQVKTKKEKSLKVDPKVTKETRPRR